MITAADLFYSVEDVMRVLDYSRAQSYKIIAKLNGELKEQGYEIRQGLISKKYFNRRYCIEAEMSKEE